MFKQPNNDYQSGFDLTFVNGWDISVKWGMDSASAPSHWLDDEQVAAEGDVLVYKTAEVAAINGDDWWDFINDMVIPNQKTGVQKYVGSDQVADIIIVIKNLYLDEFSRWRSGIHLGAFNRTPPPDPEDGFVSVDTRQEVNLKSS